MKVRIKGYIEGRTETMISEEDLDFEKIFGVDGKRIGPSGVAVTMRTQKRNTLYSDNNCTVELIFNEAGEEYQLIKVLTDLAKERAGMLERFIMRRSWR